MNALVAADAVLIPLNCEYFALEGLADLVATLRRVRAALNPSLDIAGVLMTMYDERTNLGQQVARDIREFFKERVFDTVIPRNVRLGEAPSHGLPAILYDVKSRGVGSLPRARARAARARSRAATPQARSNTMAEKRPALGRGLSALIPDTPAPPRLPAADRALEIDTDLLRPNKFQPRTHIDDERIEDLARSIRANGIIQPIVVRQGRRRLRNRRRRAPLARRAARRPAQGPGRRARHPDDRLLAVALIENIQREDLNPIEEARRLSPARRRVPPDAGADRRGGGQGPLVDRQLPAAAASCRRKCAPTWRRTRCRWDTRARCSALADEAAQLRLARDVVARSLSVRETEALVKKAGAAGRRRKPRSRPTCTRAPPKRSCVSRSARASRIIARARAAASRSIS